ncbi:MULTISPECIES: UDP-glucose 4-epimerase GalE [unclassified Modestobacter]
MRVLVTGGAGYIGSVVTAALLAEGHEVTVLDDLSTGHADAVPDGARLVQASLHDSAPVLAEVRPEAVLHFAAKSLVGESQQAPELYWENNVGGSLALLEAMRAAGCRRIVFSSTAATYGEPTEVPIPETAPTRPTNTYGASKLAVDAMLTSYAVAHDFAAVSLRYFNVGGAAYGRGERHATETHLIPIALQVAAGTREALTVYGEDYPTPDGTCIRDYVHVQDLAAAHLLALPAPAPGEHRVYNLGSGSGFSVQEMVDAVREVTGHELPVVVGARRAGDPARLVASSARISDDLGWRPVHTDLREIVGDAWAFVQQRGQVQQRG